MRRPWAGVLMMLAACGGGLKPSGGVGDRAACQAMATSSAPDPYNAAAEEWNRHAAANDDTYRRFTNSGSFQAWAAANGKPTGPGPATTTPCIKHPRHARPEQEPSAGSVQGERRPAGG